MKNIASYSRSTLSMHDSHTDHFDGQHDGRDGEEFRDDSSYVVLVSSVPLANYETAKLAHPLIWLAASIFVFAAAWLFPPTLYETMLGDRNYMFMDMRILVFNIGCIVLLLTGLWFGLYGGYFNTQIQPRLTSPLAGAPLTAYFVLTVLMCLNLIAIYVFAREGGIAAFQRALAGASLNSELRATTEYSRVGDLWISLIVLPSMSFGVAYHIYRGSPNDWIIKGLFFSLAVTFTAAAILSSKRNFLARPLFAVLLGYLVWPTRRNVRLSHAVFFCVSAAFVILFMFIALAVLRNGVSDTWDAAREVTRYLLGGYNTESLIVSGDMVLPGSNRGYFWTVWIWEFPILEKLLDLESIRASLLGERAPMGTLERGPFMREHGLTINTAIPAFACSFVDFGWFGIFPFFFLGYLCAICWRNFLAGTLGGLLFYPMAGYALLELRSKIHFPGPTFGAGVILYLMFAVPLYFERSARRR